MNVSIVFPWRGGNPDRELSRPYINRHYREMFPEAELIYADDPNEDFNRGRALTEGLKSATGDLLIFADSDLYVPKQNILKGIELAKEKKNSFVVPFTEVRYFDKHSTNNILNGEKPEHHSHRLIDHWKNPSSGGINILLREKLLPFDQRFNGWGFEDAAWGIAQRTINGPIGYITGSAYHLYHECARNPNNINHHHSLRLCKRYEKAANNLTEMYFLLGGG